MEISHSVNYIEEAQLFDYAAACARLLKSDGEARCSDALPDLRRSFEEIRRCHSRTEKRCEDIASPPPACLWLLDNYYMAQREYRLCREAFSSREKLRSCHDGLMIKELCRSLLYSGQGTVSAERCRIFLDGFQSVTVLCRAELGLFGAALRAVCLEELAALCLRLRSSADTGSLEKGFEALFGTLRLLSVIDLEPLIGGVCVQSAILAADPTGDYARMDEGTKREYLARLSRMAKKQGLEEHVLAAGIVKDAKLNSRHVGFYLFPEKTQRPQCLYIAAFFSLSLVISLFIALSLDSAALSLLLLLPVSELVKSLMDFALLRLLRPTRLCRMDAEKISPAEGRSITVISCLLSSVESALAHAKRLEKLYHACRAERRLLSFALLCDLPEAEEKELFEDSAIISAAAAEIDRLNEKYGGGFCLCRRERVFDGEKFSAFERKRGALIELAKLMRSEESALCIHGDKSALSGCRHIITLDSDTEIYPGAAGELIGAICHPLNRPRIDEARGVVIGGHGIIQPRIATELESAFASDFALIFAGGGGSDPYGSLCSELYMDAFRSGGFAGKGIIDAEALLYCTAKRFPTARILSHDALEGAYLRGGTMGDTEFCDAFPASPLSYYKRQHRWVRGDWQNLPWIFKKELPPIERFRLFDSLRRSMIAPATLLAILAGFCFPAGAVRAAAWAALLALLRQLIIALAEEGLRRREKPLLRRCARVLTGLGGAIVRAFMTLWLLPHEAFVNLSAACTALWRMFISKRKLLEWQPAAQSGGEKGFAAHIRAMLFALALGFVLLVSAPAVMGRASGLMWLLSPAAASALALPRKKEQPLSRADRNYIIKAAAENWRYLEHFSDKDNNFLPPDNFQEQPPVGEAQRSSPTNIGLAMVSAIAAADMGIISREKAADYIRRVTGSLEKMPRCIGHYYNWYDTRSLAPLSPPYISTVDSGNLYACLACARLAMEEQGERELSERLGQIMAEMDFSPLFDKSRRLFHICYDTENMRGAGGWYDLMASEAMLTSYLAAAKGDVSVKHWRRLSRAMLQKDGYRGLASWTGTMFEYLMPAIFLPYAPGSLLWESARFCLYAQKRNRFAGKPWGISESAFYSLDPSLSYRYKAHGCPALALKRGQEKDMVISPYSSFLALSLDAEGAVRNLRRLERLGARGRFGFMEALDFTPQRCRSDKGEKVRCYMAHHVGMSIAAAANAVCSGSISRRFMACPEFAAYSLLLQERLGDDSVVIRRDMAQSSERAARAGYAGWQLKGSSEDKQRQRCLLTNGAYNIMSTNFGLARARLNSLSVYENSMSILLSCEGERLELLSDRDFDSWQLSDEKAVISKNFGDISCRHELFAAAGEWGELRSITIESKEKTELDISLSFLPILADYKDYVNHPAFWKLGLEPYIGHDFILIRRLRRGEKRELWLCLYCDCDCRGAYDERLSAHVHLSLPAGAQRHVRFALCLGLDREEAVEGARRILKGAERACLPAAVAAHMGLGSAEIGAAMALLQPVFSKTLREAAPRRDLWPFGISGDLPIICCDANASEALPLLKRFCLLRSCSLDAELVYLSDEVGEYRRPAIRRISEALAALGLDSLLSAKGGVHFAPMSAAHIVKSRAAYTVGAPLLRERRLKIPLLSAGRSRGTVPEHKWSAEEFIFYINQTLPSRAWQHIISNGSLGCIAADIGPAALWYKNAREQPLYPAMPGIRDTGCAEALWLKLGERKISLFAANDGHACRVSFAPGLARWEKEIDGRTVLTSLFIPLSCDARVISIKGAEDMELYWAMKPTLCPDSAASLVCRSEGALFRAENPESPERFEFLAQSSAKDSRTDCRGSAMLMRMKGEAETLLVCGCCEREELESLLNTAAAGAALEALQSRWRKLLGRFSLSSGMERLDNFVNTWVLYQAIACRLEGRSSLYQSGGAYGFRDQLQDSVNLIPISADYARERILDACRHQYAEGDVMHWWHPHPEGDRGIRSRCSDDLLWLPWALCEYCGKTGDYDICRENIAGISSPPLSEAEHDRYETAAAGESLSVLDHARAALDCALSRPFGAHALPLFGSGDWNDALDAVDGESVWLGWFLSCCAHAFSELLEKLGEDGGSYEKAAESIGKAADRAWSGSHYYRGYRSDGSVLGTEERLDSIAQSWAAFNPYSDKAKVDTALSNCVEKLLSDELVRIFTPPYGADEDYVGYISSYGRGYRENGGQYTHAAIWLAMALYRRGRAEEGFGILKTLLPSNRNLSRYGAEPFVLAADVYSAPGHEGEAGWTWYTGSAGWYFRAVCDCILGLSMQNGEMKFSPALPEEIPACTFRLNSSKEIRYSKNK